MRPVVNLPVPRRVLLIPGQLVGQQRRDDRLVLRPPELHVLPVLLHGQAFDVAEVEDAAKLVVPAALPHPVEHRRARLDEFGVTAAVFRLVQDEPRRLDGVPGREHPPVEVVDHLAVRTDRFHDGLVLGLHEVAADLVDRAIDVLVPACVAQRLAQDLGGRDGDHQRADALARARRLVGLGRDHPRRGRVAEEQLEQVACLRGGFFVAGRLRVRGQPNRRERLSEHVPPLPHGSPFAGHVEEHPPVRIEAMLADEVRAVGGQLQPLIALLDRVVQRREQPGEPPLLPEPLVGVDHRPVAVERHHEPAALAVHAVLRPERQHVGQQPVAIDADQFVDAFGFHISSPSALRRLRPFEEADPFEVGVDLVAGAVGQGLHGQAAGAAVESDHAHHVLERRVQRRVTQQDADQLHG